MTPQSNLNPLQVTSGSLATVNGLTSHARIHKIVAHAMFSQTRFSQ